MSVDINGTQMIKQLATTLKVPASKLVSVYTPYVLYRNIAFLIVGTIMTIIGGIGFYKMLRVMLKQTTVDYNDIVGPIMLLCALMIICGVGLICCSISYVLCPTAGAIDHIVNLVC